MHHVQERGIVFVYQDDGLAARLFIGGNDEVCQPVVNIFRRIFYSIFTLFKGKTLAEEALQLLLVHVLGRAHVEVQHGMLRPLGF